MSQTKRFQPAWAGALWRIVGLATGKGPHLLADRVTEDQGQRHIRGLDKTIGDDHTGWWVFAYIEVGTDRLAFGRRVGGVAAGAHGEGVRRAGDIIAPIDAGQHARCLARGEEVRFTVGHARRQRAQRREIVQDPDRATMSASDQVAALDQKLMDGSDRQVKLHALPGCPIVE
jgi:hypothetical protein